MNINTECQQTPQLKDVNCARGVRRDANLLIALAQENAAAGANATDTNAQCAALYNIRDILTLAFPRFMKEIGHERRGNKVLRVHLRLGASVELDDSLARMRTFLESGVRREKPVSPENIEKALTIMSVMIKSLHNIDRWGSMTIEEKRAFLVEANKELATLTAGKGCPAPQEDPSQ